MNWPDNYPDSGSYQLVLNLSREIKIRLKSGKSFQCFPGIYIYSGQSNKYLKSRLTRHLQSEKKLHWNIDFLTTENSFIKHCVYVFKPERLECQLVNQLQQAFPDIRHVVKKFGANDCKYGCYSHLQFCINSKFCLNYEKWLDRKNIKCLKIEDPE